jgi:hypothetical protein
MPALRIYSYSTNGAAKTIVLFSIIDIEAGDEQRDDLGDVDLEVAAQLPDDWKIESFILSEASEQKFDGDASYRFSTRRSGHAAGPVQTPPGAELSRPGRIRTFEGRAD